MNTAKHTINSNEQFISIIVPRLEITNPDYACEGLLQEPLAIYYGEKDGEYLCGPITVSYENPPHSDSGSLPQEADREDLLPVPMAIYFGKKNGEYVFDLLNLISRVEASDSDHEAV